MNVQEIYGIIDQAAPFAAQESWDRSGLLAGDPQAEVHRVLITLDITIPVVSEAAAVGAELIVSHHPVIWDPLKTLTPAHPVWHLAKHGIAAVCAHTNLDIAEGGLNDEFGAILSRELPLGVFAPLEMLPGNRSLGRCAALQTPIGADSLAQILKQTFRIGALRYYPGKGSDRIRRIAWCTGSGGDLIQTAIAAGADALITGDCKHSVWAEAQNRAFTLFDCGHFETEVIAAGLFQRILHEKAPALETVISQKGTEPFFLVK